MVLNYKSLIENDHQGSGQPQVLSSHFEGVEKCKIGRCDTAAVQTVGILVAFFDIYLLNEKNYIQEQKWQNYTNFWE